MSMKRRIMKPLLPLLGALTISMMNSPYGIDDEFRFSPTERKDVSEIPGYYHKGIYSTPKKLRKGAGHKKLTRAQRKKLGGRKR